MATRDEVFPSKYLKAPDLKGKAWVLTIASAPLETLKNPKGGEERKTVLYFANGAKKVLPLNRVNWDSVAAICGENSDDWPGEKIELYPAKTDLRGELVDCIRIRPPGQIDLVAETKKAAKPSSPKKPEKAPNEDDDMDDALPW